LSHHEYSFIAYAFEDDTDLVTSHHEHNVALIVQCLQASLDTWEGSPNATCGVVVREKTFWYLIDFQWDNGKWRYKTTAETPASISVRNLEGERRTIKRYEVFEAQETLGIHLAPDGSTDAQADKMRDMAQRWADEIRTGKIACDESWLAIQSTIWRTLSYPLSAINLTEDQCDMTIRPILTYGLPSIGVCHNYPRKLVYAPKN
jgi:hypothetical protein